MAVFTKLAALIFRAYVTDGVPGSGANPPSKADIRLWGTELENYAHAPTAGRQTIWLPATGLTPRTTAGAGLYNTELVTNDVMLTGKAYDAATAEAAQAMIAMPKSWNLGVLRYRAHWAAPSGSGDVVWSLRARAFADNEALDATWGTAVTVTDTLQNTGRLHIAAESGDVTVGGTPSATRRFVAFEVGRDAAAGADTFSADAILIGVEIFYTTNAENDA